MFSVSIHKLGKKFRKEWIFRNLDLAITAGDRLVILGGNGSGKSTLLQVISGFVDASEGQLIYRLDEKELSREELKEHVSFASPYLQLIEELTLPELVEHVKKFKRFRNGLSTEEIISLVELEAASDKPLRQYSSGMKQRLKLGLAILADTSLLLLDEPVSNLDRNAINWYSNLVATHSAGRTIIVCSNAISEEYSFCDRQINVNDFKPLR